MEQHTEKNGSIFKIGLNLMMTCLISGIILAGVRHYTEPVAKVQSAKMEKAAKQELLPEAQDFKTVDGHPSWSVALKGDKVVGYIVPAEGKGYGGAIKILLAVSPESKVLDYKILKHNETPGLGDKADQSQFRSQFKGKTTDALTVVKTKTDTNIQALSGATITSRAVTDAIKQSLTEVQQYLASKK